ncbi:hypothetical protein [Staphylococcus equorum]|uniref:Uncharacterized protein n=1 Tax=Staphylococcus equorum TaxID=246432 RepID=A0AAP7IFM1_9STAP|nr:hypothetical protein [Staphylococcus equorum]OEK59113.1 hypothetical protein ASS94_00165 [Staphylococcus equorum]
MDKKTEYLNALFEQDEITFYTKDGIFTCETGGVHTYHEYKDLCDEWLNTGVFEGEAGFRTSKHKESDRDTYYDYKKGIWFACDDM